jgi:hypothetical protein
MKTQGPVKQNPLSLPSEHVHEGQTFLLEKLFEDTESGFRCQWKKCLQRFHSLAGPRQAASLLPLAGNPVSGLVEILPISLKIDSFYPG